MQYYYYRIAIINYCNMVPLSPGGLAMTEASAINPALSPAFDRARKISRIMAVLFIIAFWATVLVLITFAMVGPFLGFVGLLQPQTTILRLTLIIEVGITLEALPFLFVFHHAKQVFAYFAKGEVFMAGPISHMRRAGLWLFVSMFATSAGQLVAFLGTAGPFHQLRFHDWLGILLKLHFSPLFVGISVYVAAYVMEEARRIAADNAEIV